MGNEPRRNLPMSLSLIFPGWGQFYAGSYVKGVIIQLAFIGSLFYVFLSKKQLLPAGLMVPAAIWAWAVLDAWFAARRRD